MQEGDLISGGAGVLFLMERRMPMSGAAFWGGLCPSGGRQGLPAGVAGPQVPRIHSHTLLALTTIQGISEICGTHSFLLLSPVDSDRVESGYLPV